MVDRTKFAPDGLDGGQPGAMGEFQLDHQSVPPKTIMWMEPRATVQMNPPGGGGFGNPFERNPQHVLDDVVNGYVSIESASQDYGVVVTFVNRHDCLVKLPEDYVLDGEATERLRSPR